MQLQLPQASDGEAGNKKHMLKVRQMHWGDTLSLIICILAAYLHTQVHPKKDTANRSSQDLTGSIQQIAAKKSQKQTEKMITRAMATHHRIYPQN